MRLLSSSVFYILLFSLILSCASDIKEIQPEFKKPIEAFSSDLSSLVSFSKMEITTRKEMSSGVQPTKELILELTDASVITYTKEDLADLSKKIAAKTKRGMKNFESFDWFTVTFIRSDGLPVSDSTNQNAYVFRPGNVK